MSIIFVLIAIFQNVLIRVLRIWMKYKKYNILFIWYSRDRGDKIKISQGGNKGGCELRPVGIRTLTGHKNW